MVRIVNPLAVLQALAAAHPSLRYTVRLTDRLFSENDGYYTISKGNCSHSACSDRRPDLDVDVEVLASVLFSSAGAGEILDLPTSRPYMALMLDI